MLAVGEIARAGVILGAGLCVLESVSLARVGRQREHDVARLCVEIAVAFVLAASAITYDTVLRFHEPLLPLTALKLVAVTYGAGMLARLIAYLRKGAK